MYCKFTPLLPFCEMVSSYKRYLSNVICQGLYEVSLTEKELQITQVSVQSQLSTRNDVFTVNDNASLCMIGFAS